VNPQMLLLLAAEGYVFPGIGMMTVIQAVAQLFSVVVLFVILRKLLHKPIGDFLRKRAERIENDLKYAEDEKASANALKAEYEQKLKDIELEKAGILETARKLASEKAKESEAAAKTEAEVIRTRALKDIELEQERAKSELKDAVISISSVMAAKFLEKAIDEATHEQLFNETMAELEGLAWHN